MCRFFFGYEIFMPDLICFYTFANKKAALRAAAKLREKDLRPKKGLQQKRGLRPKKGYCRHAVSLRPLRSGKQQNPVYDKKGERKARPIGL